MDLRKEEDKWWKNLQKRSKDALDQESTKRKIKK